MTERRTLHDEPWSWALDQTAEGLNLTVVCGSVGLYEVTVVLEPDEVRAWQQSGPTGLQPLVKAIQLDGSGAIFAGRHRPDLSPGSR